MALSNIFREPQREITETVVGLVIPVIYLTGIAYMGTFAFNTGDRLCESCKSEFWYLVVFTAFFSIVGLVIIGLLFMAILVIHAFGEFICEILQNELGIHLRPRQRR